MQALVDFLSLAYWPIWVGFAFMFIVATTFQLLGRVPNALTFLGIGTGWLAASLIEFAPGFLPATGGGIVPSLAGTVAGLVMLLKAYKIGLGAGCLKAQMALGAWIGCALPLESALLVSVFATLCGGSTLAVLWVVSARLKGLRLSELSLGAPPPHEPSVYPYRDEIEESEFPYSDEENADHEHLPKPDAALSHFFSAQLPLAFGSIAGVLLAFVISAQGPKPLGLKPLPPPQPAPAHVGGIN